jgi:hypothetical protein
VVANVESLNVKTIHPRYGSRCRKRETEREANDRVGSFAEVGDAVGESNSRSRPQNERNSSQGNKDAQAKKKAGSEREGEDRGCGQTECCVQCRFTKTTEQGNKQSARPGRPGTKATGAEYKS